jgi:hypothetical protein
LGIQPFSFETEFIPEDHLIFISDERFIADIIAEFYMRGKYNVNDPLITGMKVGPIWVKHLQIKQRIYPPGKKHKRRK